MKFLDLSLTSPQKNLALEEALLEWAEAREEECLRIWESPTCFVVLGAGSPIHTDVKTAACAKLGVPILRRCSGGGTVLQGPGCLNYTFVLDRLSREGLESISSTSELVLQSVIQALSRCQDRQTAVSIKGYSDLTVGALKFSGNAQRRRKRFVLFHGTILYGMDLDLVAGCLGTPEKMPDYREGREHETFVTNIPVDPACVKQELRQEWQAVDLMTDWPEERTEELAHTRYTDERWITSI